MRRQVGRCQTPKQTLVGRTHTCTDGAKTTRLEYPQPLARQAKKSRKYAANSAGRGAVLDFGSRPTDFAVGNLAQRNHDLSVVRLDERFGAFEKLPRPF